MTTDANNTERITGKQVLCDAVTLLKDTGTFIFELGKTVYCKIKGMVQKNADEKDDDKHE